MYSQAGAWFYVVIPFCYRLSLAQLLDELENDDVEQPIDIYIEPPDDGVITECDSDVSDEDCEVNINHLGPKLLRANCEYEVRTAVFEERQTKPNKTATVGYFDFDSSDEESLSKYAKANKAHSTKAKSVKASTDNIKWRKSPPKFDMETNCKEQPVSKEAESCKTPLDFLKLFWSHELLSRILTETNLYASQKNLNLNMTLDELQVFFGTLLLSGYAKYPNKRMYWSGQKDVPKILQDSIRLNRFEQILRHIHLNDNHGIDPEDRLYKLRPLITELNKNFRYHGGLEENLSIDESMIPYYGRHYAKQYIRGKPIRFGFKNWALCTSNGYMVAFDIYTGKSNKEKTFGIGGDTVVHLIEAAEIQGNQGYKLYFDNYFSSTSLFYHLTERGIAAAGTIQDGRTKKCPLKTKAEMEKQERGAYDYRTDSENKMCLVRWKDNKVVTCATNFIPLSEGKCRRWSREEKSKIHVCQPEIFSHYNTYMGGVDKMDQLIAVYRTRMRQRKWWWPIFCYLLDASVTNSWLLMRKLDPLNKECSTLLIFRRNLANSLLGTYGIPSNKGKRIPNPINDIRYDGRDHWPEYVPTERLCRFCSGKSKFVCTKCAVGLHPKSCFKNYHTF